MVTEKMKKPKCINDFWSGRVPTCNAGFIRCDGEKCPRYHPTFPPAIPKKKQLKPTDICAKIGCTEEVKKVMATESHNGSHSTAQKIQSLFGKEVDEAMTETELREKLIQQYTDLQRIKSAPDRDKEIEYQIKTVKAKLEAFGVVTEDLDIH